MGCWKKGSKGRGELSSSGSFAALRMTAEGLFLIDGSRSFVPEDRRSFLPDICEAALAG
jgi:hypothetical protein